MGSCDRDEIVSMTSQSPRHRSVANSYEHGHKFGVYPFHALRSSYILTSIWLTAKQAQKPSYKLKRLKTIDIFQELLEQYVLHF